MTKEADFLQAIRETPYDDNLRLVFADWLDDRDDPRGQLIRTAITAFHLKRNSPERDTLDRQIRQLVLEHAAEWFGVLRGLDLRWSCPRGLFALQTHAGFFPALRRSAVIFPWVERLDLWGLYPENAQWLPELERFSNLTSLDLHLRGSSVAFIESIRQIPNLSNLAHLCVWGSYLYDAGAIHLLTDSNLNSLISLDLSSNHLSYETVNMLVSTPALWTRLKDLSLEINLLGDEGALRLAGSPLVGGLRKLNLNRTSIGETGALALARSPGLDSLESLQLQGNPIPYSISTILRQRFGSRLEG